VRVRVCVSLALLAMVVLPAPSRAEAEVGFGEGVVVPPIHGFVPVILPGSGHFDEAAGLFDRLRREAEPVLLPMPVPGGRFTSGYGMRRNPVTGAWVLHSGVDWSAPRGTPIMAAADGVVVAAGWESGYGRTTRILHANGIETTYAHQTAIAAGIVVGAEVIQGQIIGQVGATGNATGPHLHYEVRINGETVDPIGAAVEQAGLMIPVATVAAR
jgi:murein DD-endopeptidase MepM/ murein hydrolase activator NlpD